MYKHHHLPHLSRIGMGKFLHNKYNDLLIADVLRYLGLSMVSIFIPIFLLKTGYSLLSVVLLELTMFFFSIVFHIVFVHYLHKWGIKRSLVASYFLNIILFAILYNADPIINSLGRTMYLALLGFANITGFTLYWSSHHIFFIKSTTIKSSGSKEGFLMAMLSFVGTSGPFLGGLLISLHGFKIVFLISTVLLGIASIALFFSKDIKTKKCKLSARTIIDPTGKRKNMIYFFQGMAYTATIFLWPIFLFLSVFTFAAIGFLYLLSDLAFSLICFVGGKQADKKGNRNFVGLGSLGLGFSLILRVLFATPVGISLWQTMGGLFSALLHIPLNSGFFRLAHSDYYNKLLNREIYMYLGRIAALLIVLVLFYIIPSKTSAIAVGIFICGLLVPITNFLAKKDNSIIY
jgi:MFS family permease